MMGFACPSGVKARSHHRVLIAALEALRPPKIRAGWAVGETKIPHFVRDDNPNIRDDNLNLDGMTIRTRMMIL
jgi:hypothetical protein